ncbi:MAG: DUF4190 domain-containing protein [Phycisphaerae bacterium]
MSQIPPQQPPQQTPPPIHGTPSYRRNTGRGLPLAALIFGITAVIPILGAALGLTAVVLGIVSLVQKRPRTGMAVAGIVLGLLLPTVVMPALMLPVLSRTREQARRIVCLTNLSAIARAMDEYSFEYDDHFPADLDILVEERYLYDRDIFRCPSAVSDRRSDYFYHPPAPDAPPHTLVMCDLRGNHEDYRNVLTSDGSTDRVSEDEFQQLLKKPENADFARALREAEGP